MKDLDASWVESSGEESSRHEEPLIIPRAEHGISRKNISKNALKVLYRLHEAGYEACLVGGCVRDLILGLKPKDFDVVTDAKPLQIKELFGNCILIGRRFRLAHIRFGSEMIEVATYRRDAKPGEEDHFKQQNGIILRDNVFGSQAEDAFRRDFTLNALYYNISDFSVIDYVNGFSDLKNRTLRLIGNPNIRYQEDPLRLLRAVRFAAKLQLNVEEKTEEPLFHLANSLESVSPSRLFDEILKLFLGGCALQSFELLSKYDLFDYLFPETALYLKEEGIDHPGKAILLRMMSMTDERIQLEKSVSPAFFFATLLWGPFQKRLQLFREDKTLLRHDAICKAIDTTLEQQLSRLLIPKKFLGKMIEIWQLQNALIRRKGFRCLSLLMHPMFRAAYDFFALLSEWEPSFVSKVEWWKQLQEMTGKERIALVRGQLKESLKKRRKR